MSIYRSVVVVLSTAALTVAVLLGLARLPGGERIGMSLGLAVERLVFESPEARISREYERLQYPEHQPLMKYLVMMHIAENARQSRLKAIRRVGSIGWVVPVPQFAGPQADTTARQPLATGSVAATALAMPNKRDRAGLTITLVLFLAVLLCATLAHMRTPPRLRR